MLIITVYRDRSGVTVIMIVWIIVTKRDVVSCFFIRFIRGLYFVFIVAFFFLVYRGFFFIFLGDFYTCL